MPDERYACRECTRADLTLTANGRVRSHAANGRRPGPDNPHCPGGSDFPKHEHDYADADTSGSVCTVCGETDPRPTGQEVRNAQTATCAPNAPDDVCTQAETVLHRAAEYGVRPCLPGDHQFRNEYDDHGQFETICLLCGAPDDRPTAEDVSRALRTGGAPAHIEDAAHAVMARSVAEGMRPVTPPTGSAAQDRARGIPAEADRISEETMPVTDADSFMNDDLPEGDGNAPPYFPARYDGSCDTCGCDFGEGDRIRKAPDGGWEAEECCGTDAGTAAGQRPVTTALQLPVRAGRYRGPHPETGRETAWTRATTFAEAIADKFALTQWQLRMLAMGLVKRPDLLRQVESILIASGGVPYVVAKLMREPLNRACEDASLAAGTKDRARKGTILHKHTQELDMGRRVLADVPEEFRRDAGAYLEAMAKSGFACVPGLIERSTCLPEYEVAGTFDRILRVTRDQEAVTLDEGRTVALKAGEFVVGDVKTGTDLSYAWLEILIQIAGYAHGVTESGVAVPDRGPSGAIVWRWADLAEFGVDKLRTDVGIVMHVPYGEGRAVLRYADLITGWRGAKICRNAIGYRKIKSTEAVVAEYTSPAPETAFVPAGTQAARKEPLSRPTSTGEAVSVAQTADGAGRVVSQRTMIPGGAPTTGHRRTWEDVARAVKTKEEANKVWSEMRKRVAVVGTARLNSVVVIMRETLREQGVV